MTYGQPARRHHQAFTLTEILIVIGIIVLVIALAVPALSLMRGGNSVDSYAEFPFRIVLHDEPTPARVGRRNLGGHNGIGLIR